MRALFAERAGCGHRQRRLLSLVVSRSDTCSWGRPMPEGTARSAKGVGLSASGSNRAASRRVVRGSSCLLDRSTHQILALLARDRNIKHQV